jgi:hypothetical protein
MRVAWVAGLLIAQAATTTIEVERAMIVKTGPGLGTKAYTPREAEKKFLERAPKEEQVPGGMFEKYTIHGKKDRFVTWFGIVRKIAVEGEGEDAPRTLTLENKYFDGLTDTHILALSFNGDGDFVAKLGRAKEKIETLVLVRVYGKVVDEKDKVPTVQAEYVRVWPWVAFTFLKAYGEDHSNPEWRKLCKVDLEDIYEPFPTLQYYLDRLGPRPGK